MIPLLPFLNMEQYFGLWVIEPASAEGLKTQIAQKDWVAHIAANAGRNTSEVTTSNEDGVKVIDVRGMLTKSGSSMSQSGSMTMIKKAVRDATKDQSVKAIVLRIDSPGGTVSGTEDLGNEISRAKAVKPVVAYVEDMAASGAYWLASQADAIYANASTASIGSIGVYQVIEDSSRQKANEGIDVVVIKAGDFKGAGVEGTSITPEQRSVIQENVNHVYDRFKAAIQAGRGLSDEVVQQVATGRTWGAMKAKELGLIDGIKSFDDVVAEVLNRANSGKLSQTKKPSTITNGSKPKMSEKQSASYVQIIEVCSGLDPKANSQDSIFVCEQMNNECSVEQVQKNWMTELGKRAKVAQESATKQIAEANEKAKLAAEEAQKVAAESKAKAGVKPLATGAGELAKSSGTATEEFLSLVEQKVRDNPGKQRSILVSQVVNQNLELHKRMLDEARQKVRTV